MCVPAVIDDFGQGEWVVLWIPSGEQHLTALFLGLEFLEVPAEVFQVHLHLHHGAEDELELRAERGAIVACALSSVRRRNEREPPLAGTHVLRYVLGTDFPSGSKNDHALDEIAELAHVSRPAVTHEDVHRIG